MATDYSKSGDTTKKRSKSMMVKGKQQLMYLQSAFVNVVQDRVTGKEIPSFNVSVRHSRQDKVNPDFLGTFITEQESRTGKITHLQNIGRGEVGAANFKRMLDLNAIDHPDTLDEWVKWSKDHPRTPYVDFSDKNQKAVAFEATVFKPDHSQQGAVVCRREDGSVYQKPVYGINPRTIHIVGNGGINEYGGFDANKERELNDAAKAKNKAKAATKTVPDKSKGKAKKAPTPEVDVPDL